MEKKKLILISVLFVFILLISNISAITGKIGNGRMIITLEVGDTLDKTIRVINDNNVSVNVTLFSSGELFEDIQIIDSNFLLGPGEEKNARFKIEAKKTGNYESKINVQFAPVDSKNGVGLSSTIIAKIVEPGTVENLDDENLLDDEKISKEKSNAIWLFISMFVLLGLLLGLFFISKKKSVKKEENKLKNAVQKK